MKSFLITLFITTFVAYNGFSQQKIRVEEILKGSANALEPGISAKKATENIGTEVYIVDTISGYKRVNSSIKYLFIGGNAPKQILTVIIKGRKIINAYTPIKKGDLIHLSGKITLRKGRPILFITSSYQLATRVQI